MLHLDCFWPLSTFEPFCHHASIERLIHVCLTTLDVFYNIVCHHARYVATLSDGTVVDSHMEGDELTFITENGEATEGLDQAVMSMKKGEVATFEMTAAYCYGAAGRAATATGAAVPPNAAPLKYVITLVDFTNVS